MNEERQLINELRDTIPATQDMAHTMQGDRQERAADTIERLIRERDEARADAASMSANQCLHGIHGDAHGNPYCPGIVEAEARGYRKGVEDALRAVRHWAPVCGCEKLVLALLEQTSEPGEKK